MKWLKKPFVSAVVVPKRVYRVARIEMPVQWSMEFTAFHEAVVEIFKLGIENIVKHRLHAKEVCGARVVVHSRPIHLNIAALHESAGRIKIVLDYALDELAHIFVIGIVSGNAVRLAVVRILAAVALHCVGINGEVLRFA